MFARKIVYNFNRIRRDKKWGHLAGNALLDGEDT